MRSLITGGVGFVGRHLAAHLIQCGDDVAVTYMPGGEDREYFGAIPLPKTAQTFALDVTDRNAVEQLIALVKPDAIYHLAGIAFVPQAEKDKNLVYDVNTQGVLNVLDALVKHSKETRFMFVGSAESYGDPRPGSLPLTEHASLRPVSAYGVSKAWADLASFKYAFTDNLHVVRVRPFAHTGPGQRDVFALSSFAKQLAEIKLKRSEPVIKVGNLEAKRDYSDVSDIIRGYREALLNGVVSEAYNLCSGVSHAISELLEKLIKISGVEVEVMVEESRVRPIEIAEVYGSSQKAYKDFGWKPRIDLDTTLHTLYAHWLETLERSKS
jgi:GDP-4-dehydro-6-deoxy-D-mannose reductase